MQDYVDRQRQGFDADAVMHGPIANLTASANGAAIRVGKNVEIDVVARVGGAVGGTSPTLDVTIECSADGSTGWVQVGSLPQLDDSVTPEPHSKRGMARTTEEYVRAVLTVGGTSPDFADVEVYIAS